MYVRMWYMHVYNFTHNNVQILLPQFCVTGIVSANKATGGIGHADHNSTFVCVCTRARVQ